MKLEVVQAHLQGKSWNSYCKFYAEGPAVGPTTTLDASSPSVTPQAVKNKTQFRTKTRFRTSDPAFEQQFNVPLLDLMSKHSALRFFVMGWRGAGGAEELLGAETVTFDDMLAILAQLPPDDSCEVHLDLREDSRRKRWWIQQGGYGFTSWAPKVIFSSFSRNFEVFRWIFCDKVV